jgi:hypothetical protein
VHNYIRYQKNKARLAIGHYELESLSPQASIFNPSEYNITPNLNREDPRLFLFHPENYNTHDILGVINKLIKDLHPFGVFNHHTPHYQSRLDINLNESKYYTPDLNLRPLNFTSQGRDLIAPQVNMNSNNIVDSVKQFLPKIGADILATQMHNLFSQIKQGLPYHDPLLGHNDLLHDKKLIHNYIEPLYEEFNEKEKEEPNLRLIDHILRESEGDEHKKKLQDLIHFYVIHANRVNNFTDNQNRR